MSAAEVSLSQQKTTPASSPENSSSSPSPSQPSGNSDRPPFNFSSTREGVMRFLKTDNIFKAAVIGTAIFILAILAAIAVFLFVESIPVMGGHPQEVKNAIEAFSGGDFHYFWQYAGPLIFGTLLTSFLALGLAYFVAIGVALFISEYAPAWLSKILNYIVDLLAAIPSVIYGLWGALVLVPSSFDFWEWVHRLLGWIPFFAGPVSNPPRTVATVSLVLALMILPIITSVARDIFQHTPALLKEAAYGLGATKWEMIRMAVLPFGKSGLISASMLGLGRALGETMVVLMVLSPGRIYSIHLLTASQNQTMAAAIASQFPEANSMGVSVLMTIGLILFAIMIIVNYAARQIGKFPKKKKYQKIKKVHSSSKKKYSLAVTIDSNSSIARKKPRTFERVRKVYQKSVRLKKRPHVSQASFLDKTRTVRRKIKSGFMQALLIVACFVAIIPLASILWVTVSRGSHQLTWYFITHSMRGVIGGMEPYGGVLHALIGTAEITGAAIVISVPLGFFAAVYITEYAHQNTFSRILSFFVTTMSGIPSIVAGLAAYALFSILEGPGSMNGLVGGAALSILMIPTVVQTSEEILKVVPRDLREASYALGISKSRTILKVVIPTALPGIISGVLLAIARVIGETAPLLITSGIVDSTNFNLFSGRMTTIPVYIYSQYSQGSAVCPIIDNGQLSRTLECLPQIRMERAWAAALLLIIVVLVLIIVGRFLSWYFSTYKRRARRK